MKRRCLFFILIVLFISCNRSNETNNFCNQYTFDLLKQSNKLSNSTSLMKDSIYVDSSANGYGMYKFYPNNILKEYQFFTDTIHYKYTENYDNDGKLTSFEGSPILLNDFKELNKDSIALTVYMFDLNKDLDSGYIKINNTIFNHLGFIKDSGDVNVGKTTVIYNTKDVKALIIYTYFKVKYCNDSLVQVRDSFFMHKPSQR